MAKKTKCLYPQRRRKFKWPHVAHGVTHRPASTQLAGVLLPATGSEIKSSVTKYSGHYWWVYFTPASLSAIPAGTLCTLKIVDADDPSYELDIVEKLKLNPTAYSATGKTDEELRIFAVAVTSPAEGSTAMSHSSLTATGTVDSSIDRATLEYLDDDMTVTGQILEATSPWIAGFSCPGMAGPKDVALTVRETGTTNTAERHFTLTDGGGGGGPINFPGP